MVEPKIVHAIKTKTRTYIEIHETGSQSGIRKIALTIEEADMVCSQLEDLLYDIECETKEDKCIPENTSNPSSD